MKEFILILSALTGTWMTAIADEALTLSPPPAGVDATPILRAALAKCEREDISRLVLSPGRWELHPDKAAGMFRHISNHDPGYKRVALHLDHLDNFEIDGQGASLICHGAMIPFAVDHSKQITIRNLTIDWDKPFHLEGTVTALGKDYFDLKVLPGCRPVIKDGVLLGGIADGTWGNDRDPKEVRQDYVWNYWIDPQTRAAASTQLQLRLWNAEKETFAEVTGIGPLHYRIRNAHRGSLPELGTVMVAKGKRRMNRLSPAIHLSSSDDVLLENITIHHAGGMGLIAEDCANPTLRNFHVRLHDNPRSLVTTTADATHFVGCRGTVTIEDCLFENMLDDACNVHGIYAPAEGLIAPNRLAVSFSHFQQLGTAFARPGDRVRLIHRDTLLPYGDERRITDIERVNEDYYILTLDEPVDSFYQANSSVENIATRPSLIFRNNVSRNNRARSILVTAGDKVAIEGNRFERPSMMSILIEGDNHFWYESGAVTDVTIRDNVFIGHSPYAPLLKLAPMQRGAPAIQPPYHQNIRILNNRIEAASNKLIEARRIEGLEFSGNTVSYNEDLKGEPTIHLTACEDASFIGNRFAEATEIKVTPETTSVRIEGNKGLIQD
ncbi:right-handed parallel beta-helix repeat-containing protein [Coraliomargarita sinensis]|uniref:Right-handed parallel beta-helix repeat-containing protein n=1 Tax=Coraliomargarita sinensis TaxID=2174842 RepID=A0A317ZI98_9BACT|nr:right-handed parallel beta-helix repeat-containing protein [Coraliomargarita sinensis]PXA05306.1 right-handed parallel beta-helix repeat-containing protein [Coraliomargarita sinensis]